MTELAVPTTFTVVGQTTRIGDQDVVAAICHFKLHGTSSTFTDMPRQTTKVGKYGMLRHSYLRKHREGLYTGMLMKGTLNAHLEEVDREANRMLEQLTQQMAQEQGVTEELKAQDQMLWVQRMNNIRQAVEEIIYNQLIYT